MRVCVADLLLHRGTAVCFIGVGEPRGALEQPKQLQTVLVNVRLSSLA
jgi:hypothetical protein